jgi:hypothetical protein
MPDPNSIKDLKSEAQRRYNVYQQERTKLDNMTKQDATETQSLITNQAEKDWLESHRAFIDALSANIT